MLRVEDKYILPPGDYLEMDRRLNAILPPDLNGSPEGYRISSLYFDDLYDTNYYDTVSGNPIRRKFRIRIYNDSFDSIKLEVKTKQYSRIQKEACFITPDEMNCLINGMPVAWGPTRNDPRTLFNEAILERGLRPKVVITYNRKAYIYPAGEVRITFDRAVRATDRVECFGNPETVYDFPPDENNVLEVKYNEFLPDFLAQTLEVNSMWQISYSKYRICREIFM